MLPKGIDHVKPVHVAGKTYMYYVSARLNAKGKPILVRLPDYNSVEFWKSYAAHESARSKQASEALTVPALVRLYERSPKFAKLSGASQDAYSHYLSRFSDNFATAPAGEIERKDILKVADSMKPGAANLFVSTIGSLYRWGRERGHVENDPAKEIAKHDSTEHAPWPQELLDAALASNDDTIRLAVHLLYYTAQRIGDVLKMRWTDIKGSEIDVTQQKTKIELGIRMHRALLIELAKHPRSFETILAKDGKPYRIPHMRALLQRFAADLGFKVVPHGLRKNAVNALLEAGCSTAQTSAISGQSLQMVEHYARRRNRGKLGTAAILKWEGDQIENVQKIGK